MKIYSEITKKFYDTVEDCVSAETEFTEKEAKEKKEKEEKAAARKVRAKEIEEAYKKILDAEKEFLKLRNAFVKDYGSFHMSFYSSDSAPFTFKSILDEIF